MECASTTPEGFYIVSSLQEVSQNTPIEALLTMTQTMTMCSAFEHFMNGKGVTLPWLCSRSSNVIVLIKEGVFLYWKKSAFLKNKDAFLARNQCFRP